VAAPDSFSDFASLSWTPRASDLANRDRDDERLRKASDLANRDRVTEPFGKAPSDTAALTAFPLTHPTALLV